MVYKMIGVVLWSDPEDKKAVFWCEDQGDLAYFDGTGAGQLNEYKLSTGDMVQFDVSTEKSFRRAYNAELIKQKVCNGIQDRLLASAAMTGPAAPERSASADVIPFRAGVANGVPQKKAGTA